MRVGGVPATDIIPAVVADMTTVLEWVDINERRVLRSTSAEVDSLVWLECVQDMARRCSSVMELKAGRLAEVMVSRVARASRLPLAAFRGRSRDGRWVARESLGKPLFIAH